MNISNTSSYYCRFYIEKILICPFTKLDHSLICYITRNIVEDSYSAYSS